MYRPDQAGWDKAEKDKLVFTGFGDDDDKNEGKCWSVRLDRTFCLARAGRLVVSAAAGSDANNVKKEKCNDAFTKEGRVELRRS